jgi:uridine kinase
MIGIAGPSGSGKSVLAERLADELRRAAPVVLPLDCYYRSLPGLSAERFEAHNLDEPDALDVDLLVRQLRALAHGQAIERPHYDYVAHVRRSEATAVSPGGVVIVEGLFTLYWPAVRRLLHTRVYVDTADAACFARRMARDLRERACTPEEVRRRYERTVRPMAERYVLPARAHADVVVRGDGALDAAVAAVLRHMDSLTAPEG